MALATSIDDPTIPSKSIANLKSRHRVGMRWQLLLAFGLSFTVVFIALALWFVGFTTDTASSQVRNALLKVSTGGVQTIDIRNFAEVIREVKPPEIGAVYPENAGTLAGTKATKDSVWPTDTRYWNHVEELVRIRSLDNQASPYTFTVTNDSTLQFVGTWGSSGYPVTGTDPPDGVRLRQPVADVVPQDALPFFRDGLKEQTAQPTYTDQFGTWISAYTPLFDSDGVLIGGLGVDYEASYVNEVRQKSIKQLYPVMILSYVALLFIVGYLSSRMTRRLARLSDATQRIATGDYEVDIANSARSRWVDEMTELADSFMVMADKVGSRERFLARQVEVLKVEIDQTKRDKAVAEITDSDFFAELSAKASLIRARVKEKHGEAE